MIRYNNYFFLFLIGSLFFTSCLNAGGIFQHIKNMYQQNPYVLYQEYCLKKERGDFLSEKMSVDQLQELYACGLPCPFHDNLMKEYSYIQKMLTFLYERLSYYQACKNVFDVEYDEINLIKELLREIESKYEKFNHILAPHVKTIMDEHLEYYYRGI